MTTKFHTGNEIYALAKKMSAGKPYGMGHFEASYYEPDDIHRGTIKTYVILEITGYDDNHKRHLFTERRRFENTTGKGFKEVTVKTKQS